MSWRRFFLADPNDKRGHERELEPVGLWCTLGTVLDISISGLRVACMGKAPDRPGRLVTFSLSGVAGELDATARVVRVDPRGWKKYEMGLEFLGLTQQQRRLLEALVRLAAPDIKSSDAPPPAATPKERVPDHYLTLGVPRDATAQVIRKAFHALALKYHPDSTHTGDTAKAFQRVHDAYAALKDAAARANYDTKLSAQDAAVLR